MPTPFCFYNPDFLALNPLTSENILDYFSTSHFYDNSSINEILKMQSKFINVNSKFINLDSFSKMEGIFFVLEKESQNFFLISKKENKNGKFRILQFYFCIFGYIYQAPKISEISDSRIINVLFYLNQLLDIYGEKVKYDFLKGVEFENEQVKENPEEIRLLLDTLHDVVT